MSRLLVAVGVGGVGVGEWMSSGKSERRCEATVRGGIVWMWARGAGPGVRELAVHKDLNLAALNTEQ